MLEAQGQVLAEDVVAPFSIPPLDNTAMDGYAVIAASTAGASDDRPVTLRVVGELAAGYVYNGRVEPGTAVRIMTGAPIPTGADAIVPFEETRRVRLRGTAKDRAARRQRARIQGSTARATTSAHAGEDIREQGNGADPRDLAGPGPDRRACLAGPGARLRVPASSHRDSFNRRRGDRARPAA